MEVAAVTLGAVRLLGASFLAWLEGPPVLVSTPDCLLTGDGRALRRREGRTPVLIHVRSSQRALHPYPFA
jgi:hypothetical protein